MLLVLMWGCSPAPSRTHELRLAFGLDPVSLSPLYAFAQDQIALDLLWCQTLVGLDDHNQFVPVLITRIPTRANGDISRDGLRITYRLRRDVRFADGRALTAADVAFTYRAILDPANAASTVDQYEHHIARVLTPDDHTVVIVLRSRWSAAVHALFAQSDEAYGILPAHAFTSTKVEGSSWEQRPFGTGPFRVTAWQRGDQLTLEPNPYFHPAPRLRRIEVRIVPNQMSAFAALLTHAVDVAELSPDNVNQAQRTSGLRIARTVENGLAALYLQTAVEPTNDLHVRRAIAYAIDRAQLANTWHAQYPLARSIFPPPVVHWNAAPVATYPFDLARARRELDAAGWHLHGNLRVKDGTPLTLLLITDASRPLYVRISVAIQAQLARLGADVTIKNYTPALLAAPNGPERTGHFSVLVGRYIGGSDPEQSIDLLCSQARNGGGNYARYCSARFDALVEHQTAVDDDARRGRDFDALARIVHDDVPLIPLCTPLYIEGIDAHVDGFERNMLRFPVHPETWDTK
jgi:peptide/nickel transport system substrate-binding protein